MSGESRTGAQRSRLDAARKALLEKRLRGSAALAGSRTISLLKPDAAAFASFAQARLWFLDRLYDSTPAYHMYRATRLRGALDRAALQVALDGLVEHHEALRTRFVTQDDELYQQIAEPESVPLAVESLENSADKEAELAQKLRKKVRRPFKQLQPPLLRAHLIKMSADEHVLLLVTHHIATDEWSDEILMRELEVRYRAALGGERPELVEPTISYRDFASWQRDRIETIKADQLDFWRRQLDSELPALELPFDHARPRRPSFRGGLVRHSLPAGLSRQIKELTRTAGVTPFILLLTAFKVLLRRYTGQDEIVVGVPAANRGAPELEKLVGLFLNTLVLRSHPDAAKTFVAFLGEIKQLALEAYDHQELPLEHIVAELQPDRDLSRNPMFQVMFVHASDSESGLALQDLEASSVLIDPGVSKFDLTMFTAWHGDHLELTAEYSSDLFEESTISNMLRAFEVLLAGITADPKATLDSLPLLAEEDREKLAQSLTGPDLVSPLAASWLEILDEAVRRSPDAVAVEDEDEQISYAELDHRTRRVANGLREAGVSAGDIVGIYIGRSIAQIISLVGVLRAGAAYVPLDPAYSSQRVGTVLDELKRVSSGQDPVVMVRRGEDSGHLLPATLIEFESLVSSEPGDSLVLPDADDPAYVIFTSGSTGKPKGVVVSHANLAHSNAARVDYYSEPVGKFLLLSSFAFDSSVAGIFWTLGSGGTLVLGPPGFEKDPRDIARRISGQSITHTLMLPTLYEFVLQSASGGALRSLSTVIVAGEAVSPQVAQRHKRALPEVGLYNEYGPTEASVWATVYKLTGNESEVVPIGLPIAGTQIHLLDAALNPVPQGATGEICIEGAGVTAGYLGCQEKTLQSFVRIPGLNGATIYRSGDRGRLADGQIRYLGRIDEQIKIRGYRIEPEEVLNALRESVAVKEAAVLATEVEDEGNKLVAYIATAADDQPDITLLRRALKSKLPEYMVPSDFVVMDELPRTPNGKLDAARLPSSRSGTSVSISRSVPIEDDVLRQVLDIWRRALGKQVAPDDSFFESGGHSLLGVSVVMSIERELGVELSLSALFESPTPAALAERVRDSQKSSDFKYLIPVNTQGHRTPIFGVHGDARLLSKHLGDEQPVYMLFHNIGEADAELESVEKVAAQYLEEIRRIQPHGPYNLYGFSFGGMLAYEMAMRLHDDGEEIGFFALLDAPPPIDMSLLKVRVQYRLGQTKRSHSRIGSAAQVLQVLPGFFYRRLKNVWRDVRLFYYSATTSSKRMYAAAAIIALVGVATVVQIRQQVPRTDWIAVSAPLKLETGYQVNTRFSPQLSGLHEIELVVDRTLPQSELRDTVLGFRTPSTLDIEWSISLGDERVTAGNVTDYRYIDVSPDDFAARAGYTLLGLPVNRNEMHYRSLGLLGDFTWARGVGAAVLEAGQTYTLRVDVDREFPDLQVANPHFNVRFNSRSFLERRSTLVVQGFVGLALFGIGLLIAAAALLRKRQTIPHELINYRNLKHNMRLSRRYTYLPYPGDVSLFLPDRHEDIQEDMVNSWRQVIKGDLTVDVIEGAHDHLQIFDEVHGPKLASKFARRLDEQLTGGGRSESASS
jgi:amino acid adenylation domain-containing protein